LKHLATILTAFISLTSYSQLSIQWIGNNTISVYNQNQCTADVRISWLSQAGLQKDSIVTVNAGAQVSVTLPSQGSEIKAKSDAPCSSNGWVKLIKVLPITYFNIQQSGNGVILNWRYNSPVNIERSIDGVHFQTIASNVKTSSLLDMSPVVGVNYYRLKSDNGYSPVRRLAMWEQPVMAGVFSISGFCVAKSISSVPPGFYFIKYSDGSSRGILKLAP
jgi:hypothetical protein